MLNKISYPVETIIPQLKETFRNNNLCILSAPPGAGKTTIIPPSLLDQEWLHGRKIIMLEPRRLAARKAAEYMSARLSEKIGKTVGYRIRSESVISSQTQIEVVTEGILTRMLQSNMELPEAGMVILDEFHERSIHADTGLAFLLDVQRNIRSDLRILIMSATPDIDKLSKLLNNPPVIITEGRSYRVETHYLKYQNEKPVEKKITDAVISVLKKEEGDILVFLPGKREIKRAGNLLFDRLKEENVIVLELYGESSREEQDAALKPDPFNRRKIILATSLAETSLTIDGIRIVVDSGLSRIPAYDIRRGMPGLVTVPVSKASADQRKGRAGRLQHGVCYRLWTLEEDQIHSNFTIPEILSTDLTALALELVKWGTPKGEGLTFIDPPPEAHLNQALNVLRMLGAINSNNSLTDTGKEMSRLPVHPRLSAMIIKAKPNYLSYQACVLAALLQERDSFRSVSNINDLFSSLSDNLTLNKKVIEQAEKLFNLIHGGNKNVQEEKNGILLALAYPDRIAKKRTANQYQLTTGTGAVLKADSNLSDEEFLVIPELDGSEVSSKIFLAAGISRQDLLELFKDILVEEHTIDWNQDLITGYKHIKLGTISVHSVQFRPSDEEVLACITKYIQEAGLSILPWTKESSNLRIRSEWYRIKVLQIVSEWPVLTDHELLDKIDSWLLPYLHGIRTKKEINKLDMDMIIRSMFTFEQFSFLQSQVPEFIRVPGGSRIKLIYNNGDKPILAVKIQEMFGQTTSPVIVNGTISVLVHLLSPAMRPLAITQDLSSFWKNIYPELYRQMRVKYPKHVWPEDPLRAMPTNKIRKKIE